MDKTIYITEYNSLTEFLSDITSRPNNKFFEDRHSSETYESPTKSRKWYSTTDFREATQLLTHGWDAAAGKLATKVKLTNATATAVRSSKPSYGVVGTQASVPRYLQGIPTNMVSRQSTYAKQKVVSYADTSLWYTGTVTGRKVMPKRRFARLKIPWRVLSSEK